MKIAITGASGHVGVNLVSKMMQMGIIPKVLIHNNESSLTGYDVEKVKGNLLNTSSLANLCEGVDVIFHLAGIISIGSESNEHVTATNITGTKNILKVARNAGVNKFIHFSSIHALVHEPLNEPVDELKILATNSKVSYERTKAIAEEWVLKQNSSEFQVVVLSPTSIIGPLDFTPSLVGDMLIRVYKKSIPGVVPGGYNWVDVRDVVAAAISAIDSGRGGERYILSGKWLSMRRLTDLYIDVSDSNKYLPVIPLWLARFGVPFIFLYSKLSKQKPLYTFESLSILQSGNKNISSAKAKSELGYTSRPILDTLTDTYSWFKENNYF